MAFCDQGESYTATEKGPRTVLWTWHQAAWSDLIHAAQQLALTLLQATCGNPAALIHNYLGTEGRGLIQNIKHNVMAVLKPIEVVFLQPETALRALGCSLKAQSYWENVRQSFSAEESNSVTPCPNCCLWMDPGTCNPLSCAQAPSSENASWQRPQLYQRDQAAEKPGSSEPMLAQQLKGSASSHPFMKCAVVQGMHPPVLQ